MKLVADANTGELVEVPDTNDLVAKELAEVGVVIDDYFDKVVVKKTLEEQMKMWETENREKIKEVFKKYNIKSFKSPYGSISFVEEGMSSKVDTKKLKEDGLYDKYSYWTTVKEHLVIRVKDKSTDD